MGRKRMRAPSSAASAGPSPSRSCFSLANSMMRMAFLAARPSSMTMPIWA